MSKNKGKSFRKEALQATLKKRKECSTKALETVEKLIEKNVTRDILLQSLHHINQSSYQDIIDERSIMNICGYPVCCNELRNIPKQQYRITRTNGTLQLYDTTERKKFCSNFCYKAAKYLKDQLPSCPLWLIEPKDADHFKLMPFDCKISGMLGEQINFALKSISEMDQYQQKSCSVEKNEKKDNFSEKNKDNIDNVILNNCEKILCDKMDDDEDDEDGEEFKDSVETDLKFDNKINDNSVIKVDAVGASAIVVEENELSFNKNHFVNSSDDDDNINKLKTLSINEEIKVNQGSSEKVCNIDKIVEVAVHSDKYDNKNNKLNEEGSSYIKEKVYSANTFNESNDLKFTQGTDEKTIPKENPTKQPKDTIADENHKMKKGKIKKSKVTSDISPMLAAVLRTEQCIREWVSLDTLYFLLGEDRLRDLIEATCGLDKFQGRPQSSMQDPIIYERYLDICKKLNLLELNESRFDRSVNNEGTNSIVGPQKPVPDFEKLKAEAKELEIKVKSFYRGDKQVQFTDINENDDKFVRDTISIPLVDQHAQRALRRRIILDNLNRVLPDLLRALGLSKHNITINGDVKRLVETFTLSAHNITFRPAEWNFVAIIIIKLLSVRDEVLHQTLAMERADKYLTLMLMSYEQDSGYLNRLLTWLLYEHTLLNV